jgi:glutathione S-transferase
MRRGQHSWRWPSGAGDGRAPLFFELHWRKIAQRRVQPVPVVDFIDEAWQPRDHFIEALVITEVNLLAFERLHEALGFAVVVRIAPPSHRAHQPMRCQFVRIWLGRILCPAIRMVNQARWRMTRVDRGAQRRQGQPGVDLATERVAHHPAATKHRGSPRGRLSRERFADQHKAKNPLGKIPTLEDTNGVFISESQAICRYLARTYPTAGEFYPCDDPFRCAEVDALSDFIMFSISGPFFNWVVVSGYFPKAFGAKTEQESQIFGTWSMLMVRSALDRLSSSARVQPFVLGQAPYLPDFHLFHILEAGRTVSALFDIPFMNLLEGDDRLQKFYDAMAARG